MNNLVHTQFNLLLESYLTLVQLANPEASYNVRHALASQTHPSPEKKVIADKLLHHFDTLEAKLHVPMDRVDFFCKEIANTLSIESRGHIFFKVCLEWDNLDELLHTVHHFTPSERYEHLRIAIVNLLVATPEAFVTTLEAITDERSLFEAIFKNTELADATKYDLFAIYYHYEVLLEEFIHLITETSQVIAPLLEAFIPEVNTLIHTVKPELDAKGLGYFGELFNIDLGADSHYICYPCISSPLSLSFINRFDTIDNFNILFGIYVLPLMQLSEMKGPSEKEMADFLKALADPSKFQILKLLQNERLYASQLADKLGISNATISHHMNALLQLGIIKYEKEQNKFYYSLEKAHFKNYMEHLHNQFVF